MITALSDDIHYSIHSMLGPKDCAALLRVNRAMRRIVSDMIFDAVAEQAPISQRTTVQLFFHRKFLHHILYGRAACPPFTPDDPLHLECDRVVHITYNFFFILTNTNVFREVLGFGPFAEGVTPVHSVGPYFVQSMNYLLFYVMGERHRFEFLSRLVQENNQHLLQLLLRLRSIRVEEREDLVIYALSENNEDILFLLLESGYISDESRGMALLTVPGCYNETIVRFLLALGPVSQEERSMALFQAAQEGVTEVVRLLLDSGPLDRIYLNLAREHAIRESNFFLLALLDAYR